jgi:DNA-binding LacI/PurR family transcriptional regulator
MSVVPRPLSESIGTESCHDNLHALAESVVKMTPIHGQAVSIADVAQLAKVSKMTVSRVLNDNGPVSSRTRGRVLKAVNTLNYRPNTAARTLSTGRSQTIGVITLEGAVDGPTSTLAGIEQDARALGYSVSVSILQRPTPESIAAAVDNLRRQSVAGIVLSAPHTGLNDSLIPASTVPMVAVEGLHGRAPVVAVDQHRGAVLATEHLIDLGHRCIAHIAGPDDRFEALEREAGWRAALARAALTPGPLLRGDWSPHSGYQLAQELQVGVSAVFCANDLMALGASRLLTERGVKVPDELSVVGFDDIPEAEYLTPSLTTVHYDFYDLGRRTLERLMVDIQSGAQGSNASPRVVMEPSLIIRESSGLAARR